MKSSDLAGHLIWRLRSCITRLMIPPREKPSAFPESEVHPMSRSIAFLLLLPTLAAAQTRVRPMGEFRVDSNGVSFVAILEARSDGEFVLDANERIDQPALFASSHCTVAADAVARWADSATTLVNQQIFRPQAPERTEYEGPELPSAECAVRVDRTIHRSGSTYSLVVLPRALMVPARAAASVSQAQALAFIGKIRGTATVTLAMSNVAPGSPTNPNIAVDSTPTPSSVDQPYFEFQVERPATPMADNPRPSYPDMLRSAKVEGEVLAQFVVDTTGRPEMNTFKVLKSSHDLFTTSVKTALVNWRFHPAEVAGRKVKQVVQYPFVFGLNKERDKD